MCRDPCRWSICPRRPRSLALASPFGFVVENLALIREIMAIDLGPIRDLVEQGSYRDALAILDTEPASGPDTEHSADRLVLRLEALNGLGRWRDTVSLG